MVEFTPGQEYQLVVFKLNDEEFGVPITQVREINRLAKPTKIPKSPSFVEGVINLRGQIIPIIDLKKRFDLELGEYTSEARIIVVEVQEQVFGVIVDAVSEVLRISGQEIEKTPAMATAIDAQYIAGVGKVGERLLIILDIDKLLTAEEHAALQEMQVEGEVTAQ